MAEDKKKPVFKSVGLGLPPATRIDSVNWIRKTIQGPDGKDVELQGISVRAMRKMLESMDADDLVVYMAEQQITETDPVTGNVTVKPSVVYGIVGGGVETNEGICFLVGPEVAVALKKDRAGANKFKFPGFKDGG